ncbi:DUF917 domain-containing protein [Microlunatus sp. GCM10028923]|uniref:DUF917 domain-containing protein n=1 Tax=Microlunatus sp. GCM10028923 TaxID=3273400 RepID=UPI00360D2D11
MDSANDRIGREQLPDLALGTAILGTGGGGAVTGAVAVATAALDAAGPVPLLPVDELGDDDVIAAMAMIGAPTVGQEMLGSADQSVRVIEELTAAIGHPPRAIMASEIGGSNGVSPVAWAARGGLPLLDADLMGRAFPEGQMTSTTIVGQPQGLVIMVDALGNVARLRPIDAHWSERHVRALCVASGASTMAGGHIMPGREARRSVIAGSVSRAIAIGHAVRTAPDPLEGLCRVLDATALVEGKIIEVDRQTSGGFARGNLIIAGTGPDKGRMVRIEFQNENLIALEDGAVLASVPDLITVVDTQSAAAIFTEDLAYGQRVTALAWPSDPIWRTERGMELAGPRAFGYDLDHVAIEAAREL